MRPLTHQVWEKHYADLRGPVLDRWPQVDRLELQRISDDFDGLLALVQRATGMSADLTRMEISKLDVEEFGIGVGAEPENEEDEERASLDRLQLGTGFSDDERDRVIERLAQLGRHLARFPADGTYLELNVKERGTTSQSLSLVAELPRYGRLVATSQEDDLRAALADVREDLIRQITDAVGKRQRARS